MTHDPATQTSPHDSAQDVSAADLEPAHVERRTVSPIASPVGIATEERDTADALDGPDDFDWGDPVALDLFSTAQLRQVIQDLLDDDEASEPVTAFDERAEYLPGFLARYSDDERLLVVGERGGHSALYSATFTDDDESVALQTEHGRVLVEPSRVLLLVV